MVKSVNILQFLLLLTSSATLLTNGVLMIKEKHNLAENNDFNNLNSYEKAYIVLLIYNECFIALILLYYILYYFYYCIYKTFNDRELSSQYSIFKTLFIMTGIASNIYTLHVLIFNKNYIDENVNTINMIFAINFLFDVFLVVSFGIYRICCKNKKKINYTEL